MQLQALDKSVVLESAGIFGGGSDPELVTLTNGNVLAVWSERLVSPSDASSDIDGAVFARILTADGVPISDIIQVNLSEPFNQDRAEAVALPGGGFAVGWTSNAVFGSSSVDADTFIRIFDSSGNTFTDFRVDISPDAPSVENPTNQFLQDIIPLTENRFLVLLEDSTEYVLNSNGELIDFILRPAVDAAQLTNGNVVRAFVDIDEDTLEPLDFIELRMTDRNFDAPNDIEGINAPLVFDIQADDSIRRDAVEVVALSTGGFAVGYVSKNGSGQQLNLTVLSDVARIAHDTTVVALDSAITDVTGSFDMIALSGGGIALAVETLDARAAAVGIDILLFDADGSLQTRLQGSPSDEGNQYQPSLAELPDGRVALTYLDDSATGDAGSMKIAYFAVTGPQARLVGTDGADVLSGVGGNERIMAGDGDDEINGRAGDDKLYGQAGNDEITGGDGRDALRGGEGDDTLNGGDGADGLGGGAGDDRMNGGRGRDFLGGGTGDDRLIGGAGNDVLKGGHGEDLMTGGTGNDTFRFFNGDSGTDRVSDFDAADDIIAIALKGLSEDDVTVTASGSSTRINIGTDTDVLLQNVSLTKEDITLDFF